MIFVFLRVELQTPLHPNRFQRFHEEQDYKDSQHPNDHGSERQSIRRCVASRTIANLWQRSAALQNDCVTFSVNLSLAYD